ncbi:MAG: hypothetical protein GC172_11765 [Phycisphaera sp.]|nr:hypothetical protein [Phycisphaera sp.]
MQSAGVGVHVATQIRGAVCCAIALSGGDEVDPELDPVDPVWPVVPDAEPLAAAPVPDADGAAGFFGGVGMIDFGAGVALAAGFDIIRDGAFAAGCFALGFGATVDGKVVVWLAAGLDELEVALDELVAALLAPRDFEGAAEPVFELGAADENRRLKGVRTVPLDELVPLDAAAC